MDLICEERRSDSPFVERVWRSHSEYIGSFISMAEIHCEMVITKHRGRMTMTVRGPETRATPAYCPADAEWLGIQLKLGTVMPPLPPRVVMDRHDVNLPEAAGKSFWLHGSTWQFPDYDNVETFVDWLVRDDLLVYDPLVNAVLQGQPVGTSLRTVQRRFLQATGLTYGTVCQIERARYATSLLKQGVSILDTVDQAGYADQPHLTRSLKHFIGRTPAQIMGKTRVEPLSFLFNTAPSKRGMMQVFG
ncbi:MAG: helix-turn-helix transcriptional regulator [Chloroflexi bacterium]|nr:helix-turn-helix transcriptional regulator [Chloroflexota bacterium]